MIDDGHNVVFPRAAVTITQADREPVVADPNQVVFYNNGVPYRRRLVTATGDTSDVLLVDDSLLNDAITQYDVTALERSEDIGSGTVERPAIRIINAELSAPGMMACMD